MGIEELRNRIKSAIIIIADGRPFKVKDLLFSITDKNTLSVTGWTNQAAFDTIDREIALTELATIKSNFYKMIDISNELKEFIKSKKVEYFLNYDYGKGSVEICSEINSVTKFYNYN
jgi:hypothetical protein